MRFLIVNGPNLNLLGKRETSIYGDEGFDGFFIRLQDSFSDVDLEYYQSNVEGELVNKLQSAQVDGVLLNAAAYTHTSVAIGDTVRAISAPVVEVHISNTFSRESFRHQSYISPNVKGIVIGFGLKSYELAIQSFL